MSLLQCRDNCLSRAEAGHKVLTAVQLTPNSKFNVEFLVKISVMYLAHSMMCHVNCLT